MSFFLTALIASAAAQGPDPSKTYISALTYGGTGCPAGSVSSAFSPDRTTFTMIFDSFIASAGPGVPITDSRKNCQINVDMHYPNGWSYSIISVDYRGYAALPAGVSATQKATYYFAGEQAQTSSQSTFNGPYNSDYRTHDEIPTSNIVWSPCGSVANGNVNAQVRLAGNSQALATGAQITVDSVDGKVKQIFGVQWRRC